MLQPYNRSTYFSELQNQKKQEQELVKLLKERLPNSDVGEALFNLLVLRREVVKESLAKEGSGAKEQGEARALKELIELFKH